MTQARTEDLVCSEAMLKMARTMSEKFWNMHGGCKRPMHVSKMGVARRG